MTNRANLKMCTGSEEAIAPGRAPSGSSYLRPGEPTVCVSCERGIASVLKSFPPDPALRYPAQVFPVCGKCALLETV